MILRTLKIEKHPNQWNIEIIKQRKAQNIKLIIIDIKKLINIPINILGNVPIKETEV